MSTRVRLSDHFHKSKVTTILLSAVSLLLCITTIQKMRIEGAELDLAGPFWPLAFFVAATASGIGLFLSGKAEVTSYVRGAAVPEEGEEFASIRSPETDEALLRFQQLSASVEELISGSTFTRVLAGGEPIVDYDYVMAAMRQRLASCINEIHRPEFRKLINDLPEGEAKNQLGLSLANLQIILENTSDIGIEISHPNPFDYSLAVRNMVDTFVTRMENLNTDLRGLKGSIDAYNRSITKSTKWVRLEVRYNYALPLIMWLITAMHIFGYLGLGIFPSVKSGVEILLHYH